MREINGFEKYVRKEKRFSNEQNNKDNAGCFSSILSSILGMAGILIVIGLAAFALGFLEKVIQAVFPILIVAAIIGIIFNVIKK